MSKYKSITVRIPIEDWRRSRKAMDHFSTKHRMGEKISDNAAIRHLLKLGTQELEELTEV